MTPSNMRVGIIGFETVGIEIATDVKRRLMVELPSEQARQVAIALIEWAKKADEMDDDSEDEEDEEETDGDV